MKIIALVLFALIILIGCEKKDEIEIMLKVKPMIDFKTQKQAYIDSQNDRFTDIKSRKDDDWASFVYSEIQFALWDSGVSPFAKKDAADFIVRATVRDGMGIPRLGRHWDIITNYIDCLNITLIEGRTGKEIGEIEYKRPRFADNPPSLVRGMMERLVRESSNEK